MKMTSPLLAVALFLMTLGFSQIADAKLVIQEESSRVIVNDEFIFVPTIPIARHNASDGTVNQALDIDLDDNGDFYNNASDPELDHTTVDGLIPAANDENDRDGDAVPDDEDSCPEVVNIGEDVDDDGRDDACDHDVQALNDGFIFWRGSKLDWDSSDTAHEIDLLSSFLDNVGSTDISSGVGLYATLVNDLTMHGGEHTADENTDWQTFYTGVAFDNDHFKVLKRGGFTASCTGGEEACTGDVIVGGLENPGDGYSYHVALQGIHVDADDSMGCKNLNEHLSISGNYLDINSTIGLSYSAQFNGPETAKPYTVRYKYILFATDDAVWDAVPFEPTNILDLSGNTYATTLDLDLSHSDIRPAGEEQAFVALSGWGFQDNRIFQTCEFDSVYAKMFVEDVDGDQATINLEGAIRGFEGTTSTADTLTRKPNQIKGELLFCKDAHICRALQDSYGSDFSEQEYLVDDLLIGK